MSACVYIAWNKITKTLEFGRIWKFMWTRAAGEDLHKYFQIQPNSRVFSIFYFLFHL